MEPNGLSRGREDKGKMCFGSGDQKAKEARDKNQGMENGTGFIWGNSIGEGMQKAGFKREGESQANGRPK